jgi:hypothetical protein
MHRRSGHGQALAAKLTAGLTVVEALTRRRVVHRRVGAAA